MDSIYTIIERSKYPETIEGFKANPIIGKESVWVPLGDKLSLNERTSGNVNVDQFFTIRLDGKNFSTVIPRLKKMKVFEDGYSETFEKIMKEISVRLFNFLQNTLYVFTQSDEITIIVGKTPLDKNGNHTTRAFNGRKDKYLSLTASFVSTTFYQLLIEHMITNDKVSLIGELPEILFDARMGVYDSLEDAFELILWRSYDCSVNGISSAIYFMSFPNKKKIMSSNSGDKLQFLLENSMFPLPDHQVYGSLYTLTINEREVINRSTGEKYTKTVKSSKLIPGPVISNIKDGVITL